MDPTLSGIIAIVRLGHRPPSDELLETMVVGGVNAIEVTANTPQALSTASRWVERSNVPVGIGTVRTSQQARTAIEAGAQFLVTPTLVSDILVEGRRMSVPVICGALTPTEIDCAWQQGAAAVKVFPVDTLGGSRYVRSLQGPMPDVPLVPTGGIGPSEAREYSALGCTAVGVGSSLVDEQEVAEGHWQKLRQRASLLAEAWASGSGS